MNLYRGVHFIVIDLCVSVVMCKITDFIGVIYIPMLILKESMYPYIPKNKIDGVLIKKVVLFYITVSNYTSLP